MAKILPTFKKMFDEGKIAIRGGLWIDIYNQCVNESIAGTIHTRISHGNYWFVTELYDKDDTYEGQGPRGDGEESRYGR